MIGVESNLTLERVNEIRDKYDMVQKITGSWVIDKSSRIYKKLAHQIVNFGYTRGRVKHKAKGETPRCQSEHDYNKHMFQDKPITAGVSDGADFHSGEDDY